MTIKQAVEIILNLAYDAQSHRDWELPSDKEMEAFEVFEEFMHKMGVDT